MRNASPGWYPDPGGGPKRKFWDGDAWHDPLPTSPGFRIPRKTPRKISAKALFIAAAVFAVVGIIGTVAQSRAEEARSASSATANCDDAPAGIVAVIDAAFTDGEQLENAQSINLPKAMTIVGGNIVDSNGSPLTSQGSWLFSGGVVYALTSDARRHTMLPDGRDLLYFDWATYSDQVGTCVGRAAKAAYEGMSPPG